MTRTAVYLFTVLWISSSGAQLNGYDEIFDEKGEVRPHYAAIYQAWESIPEKKRNELFENSKKAFEGDNYLEILPRILTSAEFYGVVKPGIEQRAQAIRAFLMDHYSGSKNYARDHIVPESVVTRAMSKTTELGHFGKLDPSRIAFMYGPDLIRDENGNWRVIEDNPGYLGGLGDLDLAYKYLAKSYPELKKIKHKNPEEFYKGLTDVFKNRADLHDGRVVMYMSRHSSDNEDPRLRDIFVKHGVMFVTPKSQTQLKISKDAVYVFDTKKGFEASKEKVGFIFINGEHDGIDPSYFEVQKKLIREEALSQLEEMEDDREGYEELIEKIKKVLFSPNKKTGEIDYKKLLRLIAQSDIEADFESELRASRGARGLIKAILEGKVESSYSPGVDFIGDKEFYIYVPELIRYYLQEEVILQNIPTQSFADPKTGKLRKKEFAEVFRDLKGHVIKPTDGRGGDGIFIGPYMTKEDAKRSQKLVKSDPEGFIHQSLMTMSHLRNLIVDLRGYAFVDGLGVWVGDHMFSRGLPMDRDKKGKLKGNGKVNLSDQGRELLVLVSEGGVKFSCSSLFKFKPTNRKMAHP
ncbi:MAG: circularly permuted type 2 ATP-grasp protein [Pseudomonadota bacterium]|nr:circularly permuted type 2 ATP-grasp protein [Pseudomonadota bacterium]